MKKNPRDKSIGAQMAITSLLMKRNHQQVIAQAGYKITIDQLDVLQSLKLGGEMSMTKLSAAVWKQNANITRIVDKLEKRDLVTRKAVEGDRRVNLLGITGKGKKLAENAMKLVFETNKEVKSCMTKEEEAISLRVMKKIIAHLS